MHLVQFWNKSVCLPAVGSTKETTCNHCGDTAHLLPAPRHVKYCLVRKACHHIVLTHSVMLRTNVRPVVSPPTKLLVLVMVQERDLGPELL